MTEHMTAAEAERRLDSVELTCKSAPRRANVRGHGPRREHSMSDEQPTVPYGYCHCGCGEKTRIAHKTVRAKGWVKGQPLRYVNTHNNPRRRRHPDRYEIRDCGYETPCWVWRGLIDLKGYGYRDRKDGSRLAHRIIYERERGPIPHGLQLDHLCRNPPCVNPDHLEPVTAAENQRRGLKGKLSHEQVREIYRRAHSGELQVALALRFGVSESTISCIKLGKRAAEITGHLR